MCGVTIVFALLLGLYGWGIVKNRTYIAVVLSVVVFMAGIYLLYYAFDGVRQGVIAIRAKFSISVYERRRNPFVFWFYISLFSAIGLLTCGLGISIIYPGLHLFH